MSLRAALALFALLAGGAAFAYVMPSSSILRRMVDRREDLKLTSLRVQGTVVFPKAGAREAGVALGVQPGHELHAEASFSLKLPGRCRFEVWEPGGGRLAAISAHGKSKVEGKALQAVSEAVAQVCPLLALRAAAEGQARASVERHLRELGIEGRDTALSRLDGRVVFVLGKQGGPGQLWVYKDTFLPARVLYRGEKGVQWDVRFKDFGSPVAGDWFPRVVEVRRGDEPLLRFTVLEAQAGVALGDALF